MAYRQPGVTVTQEFLNALPALAVFALPNVTVGPIFQVVSKAVAGTYSGSAATFGWASQIPGTFIDLRDADPTDLISYPIKIELKNAIANILSGSGGSVASGNLNVFVDSNSNAFANVVKGDVIYIASGPNAGSYTVRAVNDLNHLQTNETFSTAGTSLVYSIRRNLGLDGSVVAIATHAAGVSLDADSGVSLPVGLTTDVDPIGSVPILSASVLLTYRALRTENSADTLSVTDLPSLQAAFGIDQIVPENPAVFGAYVALNNSFAATNILGLSSSFLSNENMAYLNAFSVLELADMYAISVMSHNTAVHTGLKAHVDGMSNPLKKLERVGIINRKIVTQLNVTSSVADSATDSTGLKVNSASSHFITDGVVPGNFVNINGLRIAINAVNSQTQVTLRSSAGASLSGEDLVIDKDLSKDQQAVVMAAYASSIADRRMVITFPDVVKAPVGNLIRPIPGYFLNCCVGALTTGLPTQQGLTNLSIALFTGVTHSTKYFTNDQLNVIAAGGMMIFVQDILDDSPLIIRHELTSDLSAIKYQEYMVTKNVDFIAKFIRNLHKGYIGQYNIVDGTFDDLKTSAKGIIKFLIEGTKRPKIGGVVRNGILVSVQQDLVNIDAIVEKYSFDIPIPLNNLDITIIV